MNKMRKLGVSEFLEYAKQFRVGTVVHDDVSNENILVMRPEDMSEEQFICVLGSYVCELIDGVNYECRTD